MDFLINKSKPKNNPFAPEWLHIIGETMIDTIDTNHLANLILSKKDEIINSTKPLDIGYGKYLDGGTGLGPDSLTSRFYAFNVFTWEDKEVSKLFNAVRENYLIYVNEFSGGYIPETYIQCWANVMDPGEKIKLHYHSAEEDSYLSGHFCVQAEKSETHYSNPFHIIDNPVAYSSDNIAGKMTIFQSFIPHKTSEHIGINKRITIAFDIFTVNQKNKYQGNELRKFVFLDAGNQKNC